MADPTHIGRYRVEGPLGAGGVGMVFAAFDPVLGRRVAVKLLRSDRPGMTAAAGDRLREEAQAMARLAHPNVVTVYDVGEHEGGVYIAMELVEGLSLRDWLAETARPWREVLGTYFQAGRGLAAAHDAGLVHRDFKPANVLVGRDGRVRVVDFGLASDVVGGSTLPHVATEEDDVTELDDVDAANDEYHRSSRLTEVETTVDESGVRAQARAGGPRASESATSLRTGDGSGVFEGLGPADALQTYDALYTRDGGPRVQSELRTIDAFRTPTTMDPLHTSDMLRTLVGPEVTAEGHLLQTMAPDPAATRPGVATGRWVAGTPAYMAPEQFLGRPADARSDQFAFSVALYEGLYGRRPFAGDTAVAIAEEVLAGRVLPPPRRTKVPRWIHVIVEQGLALHRHDRHASVRSMLASIAFLARVVWN